MYNFIEENKLNLKYIILTHGHGDHIQGLNELANHFPNAKVFIGEEEKDFLFNSEYSLSDRIFGENFKFNGTYTTVKEGDLIGDFLVLDTPGHTIGSKCFYNEENNILIRLCTAHCSVSSCATSVPLETEHRAMACSSFVQIKWYFKATSTRSII